MGWNPAARGDTFWWIAGIDLVLVTSLSLSWCYWEELRGDQESLSTTVRNVGVVIAGCPMFVGGSASRYITTRQDPTQKRVRVLCLPPRERDGIVGKSHGWTHANEVMSARILETNL